MASSQPTWKPEEKVLYGGLSALTTVGVIAIARWAGTELDPVVASGIVTAVFGAIAYLVPNKYRGHLDQADAIAQLLAARNSRLSPDQVRPYVEDPASVAELIARPDAIEELVRQSARRYLR